MPPADGGPAAYQKGDRVLMWNADTKQLDKEGVVNQVLDDTLTVGEGELPAGSVGVSSLDGMSTLWVQPEHLDMVIKKVEGAFQPPDRDRGPAPILKQGDQVVVRSSFEAPGKLFGSLFGSSFAASKLTRGTRGVVEEITDKGEAVVSFEGSWGKTSVPKEKFGKLELAPAAESGGGGSAPSQSQEGYAKGDQVCVWSSGADQWETDGVVVDVSDVDFKNGDMEIPAGSVLVSYRKGAQSKWIKPEHLGSLLAPANQVGKLPDGPTSPPALQSGVAADVVNMDQDVSGVPGTPTRLPSRPASSTNIPLDPSPSSTSSQAGGEDEEGPESPGRLSGMSRKPSPPGGDGALPQDPAEDETPGERRQGDPAPPASPKTPGARLGSAPASPAASPKASPKAAASAASAASSPPASPKADAPADAPAPAAPGAGDASPSPATCTGVYPDDDDEEAGAAEPRPIPARKGRRILVIGPGFGEMLNPTQFHTIRDSGYEVHVIRDLPNPETPTFPAMQYIGKIKEAIDQVRPHLLMCASKGGAYLVALWQAKLWTGPSVLINRHPTLLAMPKDCTVVLAVGSKDEVYGCKRADLEALVQTGTSNRCFLYYTANSGWLGRGYTREGDTHNMASLIAYDCLPRLADAALAEGGPELQLMRSWAIFKSTERIEAERWLGYEPRCLRKFWQSEDQKGMDDKVLFEVDPSTEEFEKVATIFRAQPTHARAYFDMNPGMWQHLTIARIERVENGMQEDGNAEPYFRSLERGITNQGVEFVPGVQTTWAFHGSTAIESIVSNPISGFQPLMSGSRAQAVWGSGTYFARDAKYVYDGGFCAPLPDGTKQILLCQLMTGMVCLGDPEQKGVLPIRHKRHRYNASVDSLSNPEIYITQQPGAAYPAYVISFT